MNEHSVALFWAKVDRSKGPHGCWLWTASTDGEGYGQLTIARRPHRGHRVAYELLVGPIPTGLHIDHLCRVRICVNPAHLEAVPQRVNTLRGFGATAINARKTHCPRGHELSGDNLYATSSGGRQCRTCRAAHAKKVNARRLASRQARTATRPAR